MISKAEFLDKVKKEISKTNKRKIDLYSKKILISVPVFFALAFFVFFQSEFLYLRVFVAAAIIYFFIYLFMSKKMEKEGAVFIPLEKSGLFLTKKHKVNNSKLLLNLFGKEDEDDWIVEINNLLSIPFEKQNSILLKTDIFRRCFNGHLRMGTAVVGLFYEILIQLNLGKRKDIYTKKGYTFFSGLVIEVNLKNSYKNPVVFAKKGFLNRRKGLKKVQLRYKDLSFDVFSNDINAAQNLCFKGLPSNLLRLKDSFACDKIEACFFDNKLYVALYTKRDLFRRIAKHSKDIHEYELFYDKVAQLETYCAQFLNL